MLNLITREGCAINDQKAQARNNSVPPLLMAISDVSLLCLASFTMAGRFDRG